MAEGGVPAWQAVGAEVMRLRELRKMTQRDLQDASGVSISLIAEIEAVKIRNRRAGTLERLSVALGQPPGYLDDILAGRRVPGPVLTPPEQVLHSIRASLRDLAGQLDALLARYDAVWYPRQSAQGETGGGSGHGEPGSERETPPSSAAG